MLRTIAFAMPILLAGAAVPAVADTARATPASGSHAHADWAGLWVGVEGGFVEITPTEPAQYTMAMQGDLEDSIQVSGQDAAGGIAFQRKGETFLLRPATGEEIGLKWLEDKTNCLMVQEGEGFCRK